MRILADENIERILVAWLRNAGHDVVWVVEEAPSASDRTVLDSANAEGRIVLTYDLDFGELVRRAGLLAPGIILLRFNARDHPERLRLLQAWWPEIEANAVGNLVVAHNDRIRVRGLR